uniref:Uncharacterized protein n=1 Tax=Oryza punctata TaxID=4537 RepID=A0A0E0L9A0_ORYPU
RILTPLANPRVDPFPARGGKKKKEINVSAPSPCSRAPCRPPPPGGHPASAHSRRQATTPREVNVYTDKA